MMQFESYKQFDFLSEEYAELFKRADATAFQAPIWLDRFYAHLPKTRNAEPLILTARKEGQLVAVLPMIRRKSKGFSLVEAADLGVGDYSAPVIAPDIKLDAFHRLEIKQLLGRYDLLRVRPVRDEHISAWAALLGFEGIPLDFSAHAVDLHAPFEDWRREHLDKKIGGMIARKGRRWRKQHAVELEHLHDPATIELAIRNLVKLRAGRFEGDPIQGNAVEDFYCDVAVRAAKNGLAETWLATSDGQIAAVLFGLTYKGRFLYLLIGADYQNSGRHSPGLQMYDWIIEDWLARGGDNFDFTIGDEPFKAQFGAKPEQMFTFIEGNSLRGKMMAIMTKWMLARAYKKNMGSIPHDA